MRRKKAEQSEEGDQSTDFHPLCCVREKGHTAVRRKKTEQSEEGDQHTDFHPLCCARINRTHSGKAKKDRAE
jgi:hypothetical protein